MSKKITDKQLTFVGEYLVDLNATQAAIRAGYSKKTAQEQASRLLSNVMVSKAIAQAMKDRSLRCELSQDFVLQGFMDVFERCMQRAPVPLDGDQVQAKDGNGGGVWTFNATGANQALSKLGEHLGIFKMARRPDNDPLALLLCEIDGKTRGLPENDPANDPTNDPTNDNDNNDNNDA